MRIILVMCIQHIFGLVAFMDMHYEINSSVLCSTVHKYEQISVLALKYNLIMVIVRMILKTRRKIHLQLLFCVLLIQTHLRLIGG